MDGRGSLTPGAHRVIRLLDGRESAYAGELITDGESRGVRVDALLVPDALWAFAGAEHVAGVRDVLRRSDGHDAMLPWCTDRVDGFLGRRAAAEVPLAAGEVVTLVGSLLRGVVEVGDRDIDGHWWLTDDARPLFAPGEGLRCAAAAGQLIIRMRETGVDRAMDRLLGEIAGGAGDPRVVQRSIERWERQLTELAAPRPLNLEVFAPERVAAIEVHRSRLPADAERLTERPAALRRLLEGAGRLAELVRERAGELLRGGHDAPAAQVADGPRGKAVRPGRGRMLLVGVTAAAAVLVGGLIWPAPEDDSAATERPARTVTDPITDASPESPEGPPSPQPNARDVSDEPDRQEASAAEPAPDVVADGSIEAHAVALLAAAARCAEEDDVRCAEGIVEGAGEAVLGRLSGAEPRRSVTAVEEYGDVSVLRLGASGEQGEQMLVLVAQKGGWLIRDVYDVADQPSDQG